MVVSIPLGTSDWQRSLSIEPTITVHNRYYEKNPTNLQEQSALLTRPGLNRAVQVGTGPIRAIYSQPGTFEEALFVVSGEDLYRVDIDMVPTLIKAGFLTNESSSPSMAATSRIGSTPEYLFLCEGAELWLYTEDGFAVGTLQSTGTIVNNDTVRLGNMYYKWTNASVDAGTPAGTLANPWLVNLGATNTDAFRNLYNAVNNTGTGSVDYSNLLTPNVDAYASSWTPTSMSVTAFGIGIVGNGVVTTETGANLSWGGGTLSGGGAASVTQVPVPDEAGVISVGYISSFVIVVIAQGYGVNGRFYWINPGETTIDALDFATAERSPDPLHSVRVVGDQFWLLGSNSTEVWYPSGLAETPFLRIQGRLFDRGIWAGTDVQVKDSVLVVDNDGVVYNIGSSPQRISDNSVEERIRKAMAAEKTELGD